MNLKMVLPGDTKKIEDDAEIFSLSNIKSKKHLDEMDDIGPNLMDDGAAGICDKDKEEIELEDQTDDDDDDNDSNDDDDDDNSDDDEDGMQSDEDENDEKGTKVKSSQNKSLSAKEKNPLVVELEPDVSSKVKADQWFKKVTMHTLYHICKWFEFNILDTMF